MHVFSQSIQYTVLPSFSPFSFLFPLPSLPLLPSHSFPPTPSLPLLPSLPSPSFSPNPSQLVRTLLEDLPGIFANNRSIKCAMGAALQAAEKLLVRGKGSMNYLHVEDDLSEHRCVHMWFLMISHCCSSLSQHLIGGRVTVLQTTLPNVGPGALKYRDVAPSSVKKV